MVAIPGRVTVHCWSNVALSVDYLLIFPTPLNARKTNYVTRKASNDKLHEYQDQDVRETFQGRHRWLSNNKRKGKHGKGKPGERKKKWVIKDGYILRGNNIRTKITSQSPLLCLQSMSHNDKRFKPHSRIDHQFSESHGN
jgi:hypothetical protein